MSPSDKSTARSTPCSGCLDLRPELYRRLRDVSNFWFYEPDSLKHADPHYYISSFSKIEEMSKGGCKYCSILGQGLRHFWDLDAMAQGALHVNSDESNWNKEMKHSFGSRNDSKEFYLPCIEIRPGRGLLVSLIHGEYEDLGDRIDFVYVNDHFRTVRAPLEFYSTNGNTEPIPSFGRSVNIPTDLTAGRCGKLLNEWLRQCNSHEDCLPNLDAGCPKRLIQVSGSLIRLIDAGHKFKENYTTLSHRWGTEDDAKRMFKTTRSNFKNLRESICWDSLPRTFQDAITITRGVSCNYIWIDSLCIIQKEEENDDDDADWKEQAPQMSSIYTNSYLNIAATASHDGNGGLLFPRFSLNEDITSSGRTPVDSVELSHGVSVRPDLQHVHSIFLEEGTRGLKKGKLSPLLTRAWVFQEQVLPGRTVHFTYSEMVWECRHHTVCECGGLNDWGRHHINSRRSFNDSITGKAEPQIMLKAWRGYVSEYTTLEVTNHEDWPFAIAGIASGLQQKLKSHYIAGLWEADFPAGLLWSAGYTIRTEPLKDGLYHWKPSEDTPPTWSWLRCIQSLKTSGISPSIYYAWDSIPRMDVPVPDSRFGFNLIDATDRPDTKELLTCFTNVRLRLRGAALKGLARIRSDGIFGQGRDLIVRFPEAKKVLEFTADFPLPTILRDSEFEVLCLLLGLRREHIIQDEEHEEEEVVSKIALGLILSDFCSPGSFYVRIGEFSFLTPDMFKESEVRDIEIR